MRKLRKYQKKNLRSQPSIIEQLETRRLLATINIVDFGARPNDGIDDTAAIQAAINASKAGDTINFGSGTFDAANIKILGNRTYTGDATIKRNKSDAWIFDAHHGADGAKIKGLTFDGGGIYFGVMARNVEITNNTIKNIGGGYPYRNGIFVPAGAENSKFNHNSFYNINGETGIYGFTHFKNVEMNYNHFDTVMEGIHLWYESGENLTVSNNTFIRTRRMAVELQGFNAKGIYVENNKASEWRDRYHESFFLSIVNQGYDVVVRNNHGASGKFGEIDPLANDAPIGLEISGWGVLVEGNVIEGFREGMHLMNIRDAVVRNNKFYNQTWMAIWRTGVGNSNFNGNNLRIENNEIYNPKVTAFLFHGSSTGIIQNNTITLFSGQEYWDASSNGTAFNGVNRAGNQILRPGGNPQPYKGPSPVNGGVSNPTPPPVSQGPATPSGLTASATAHNQVNLTWKDNSSNEDGFKLFRRQSGTSQWVLVATLGKNTTSYKDGDVKADTKYYYRVQSYNASGHSDLSNEPNVTTPSQPPVNPGPVTAPAAPSGLSATPRAATQIDLTWKDNANNETAFKLFRREANSNEWVLVATINANNTVYKDGAVQPDKEYVYRIQSINTGGQSAFSNEVTARTPAQTPPPSNKPGTGRGLIGEYFDNMDLTNKKGERIDGVVNFDWQLGSPMDGIQPDTFSVRWTGQIEARYSEEYTFYAGSDDGVRLWIDGKLVIDSWHDQRNTEKTGKITLQAGRKYDIKLEYYENQVGASVHLAWSSASQAKEIVPESQLSYPASSDQRPHVGNGAGLTGEYFDNKDLTNKKLERIENINFDWREGSPDSRIANDTFSVRWTGQILAQYSEEYTFYTTSDDGVRLWVDGKLIIDHWNDHAATTHTGKITLEAGRKYDIRMEYYENAGVASAMLGWSSRSQAWEIVPKSQLFASNSTPPVQQPSPGVDLAAGKKAVASSVQSGKVERLNYLTDGDDTTRWASQLGSDNEWIYVDLGGVYSIDRVRLNWETAFAKTYEIQVSDDGQTWTTVYRTSNGDGKIDDLTGLSASGRYVKMLGLERGFPAGFSLWSMEVYGVN